MALPSLPSYQHTYEHFNFPSSVDTSSGDVYLPLFTMADISFHILPVEKICGFHVLVLHFHSAKRAVTLKVIVTQTVVLMDNLTRDKYEER